MSGTKVWEHSDRIEAVEMELLTRGVLPRTVRDEVVNDLTPNDMSLVCGDDGVLIPGSQNVVRRWFHMGIFRLLRSGDSNQILSHSVVDCLAEVGWDGTGIERLLFKYEKSKFIFIPLVFGVKRECGDGMEVTKKGHEEIHLVSCEELVDHGVSREFAEQICHLFHGKSDDYMEYPMLEEQARVTGYRKVRSLRKKRKEIY